MEEKKQLEEKLNMATIECSRLTSTVTKEGKTTQNLEEQLVSKWHTRTNDWLLSDGFRKKYGIIHFLFLTFVLDKGSLVAQRLVLSSIL